MLWTGALLLWLASPGLAQSPDEDAMWKRVQAMDAGPDGCWVVTGTAQWSRDARTFATSGSAGFEAVLDRHVWLSYRLTDVVHVSTFAGASTTRAPVRQFLFVFGDDPVVSAEVPGWRTVAPMLVPPLQEDVDARGRVGRVVTSSVAVGPDSDTLDVHAQHVSHRAEWSWVARFPHDASQPVSVRFEGDSARQSRSYVPFGYELRVRADGIPESSSSWNQWGVDDVTFATFTRCPADVPRFGVPVAGALFEDERPELSMTGSVESHAVGRRLLVFAQRRQLEDQFRRSILGGGFALGWAAIAFASSFAFRDDKVLRGVAIGGASTVAAVGVLSMVRAIVAKRSMGRRYLLLRERDDAGTP